jgi:hypothetical protein
MAADGLCPSPDSTVTFEHDTQTVHVVFVSVMS